MKSFDQWREKQIELEQQNPYVPLKEQEEANVPWTGRESDRPGSKEEREHFVWLRETLKPHLEHIEAIEEEAQLRSRSMQLERNRKNMWKTIRKLSESRTRLNDVVRSLMDFGSII